MKEYIIYCTKEQTHRAYNLGAPIELIFNPIKENRLIEPTTQQMIGWLREEKEIDICVYKDSIYNKPCFVLFKDNVRIYDEEELFDTYKQAELTAIDAALTLLEESANNK